MGEGLQSPAKRGSDDSPMSLLFIVGKPRLLVILP
jgi:hypothetical protein